MSDDLRVRLWFIVRVLNILTRGLAAFLYPFDRGNRTARRLRLAVLVQSVLTIVWTFVLLRRHGKRDTQEHD